MGKVAIEEVFDSFDEKWSPRLAGECNGQAVKLAKVEGEFIIVPRGVEHRPVAEKEAEIMLFEPSGTRNTGNVETERTRTEIERIE
jgi:hypothetical protein